MMDKPRTLPPTMRDRRRYIAFEVISDSPISFADLVGEFWNSLLSLLGELGTSKANVWFAKDSWKDKEQIGLIRCDNDTTEHVRASIALISEIGGKKALIHTLGISGTMKAARRKFFGETGSDDPED